MSWKNMLSVVVAITMVAGIVCSAGQVYAMPSHSTAGLPADGSTSATFSKTPANIHMIGNFSQFIKEIEKKLAEDKFPQFNWSNNGSVIVPPYKPVINWSDNQSFKMPPFKHAINWSDVNWSINRTVPPCKPPVINVTPTPSPEAGLQLVKGYTDKGSYKVGETVTGTVELQSIGKKHIDDVAIQVSVYKQVLGSGYIYLGSKSVTMKHLNIAPGQVKKLEKGIKIPSKYGGIVSAGNYRLDVTVSSEGSQVGSFSAFVTVT